MIMQRRGMWVGYAEGCPFSRDKFKNLLHAHIRKIIRNCFIFLKSQVKEASEIWIDQIQKFCGHLGMVFFNIFGKAKDVRVRFLDRGKIVFHEKADYLFILIKTTIADVKL